MRRPSFFSAGWRRPSSLYRCVRLLLLCLTCTSAFLAFAIWFPAIANQLGARSRQSFGVLATSRQFIVDKMKRSKHVDVDVDVSQWENKAERLIRIKQRLEDVKHVAQQNNVPSPTSAPSCAHMAGELDNALKRVGARAVCLNARENEVDVDFHVHRAKGFNQRIDELMPDMVVADLKDVHAVADVVKECARLGLRVAVKGGGHHPLRPGSPRRSVVLDLSEMRSVNVDANRMTATVGGGARWQHVNDALIAHGLVANGGACPMVGVVGFHLGGGIGFNSRRRGLGVDSWLEATVVLANGRIVTVRAPNANSRAIDDGAFAGANNTWRMFADALRRHGRENAMPSADIVDPDGQLLFWALKGSGHFAQLGVVTSITVRVYPLPGQEAGDDWQKRQLAAESDAGAYLPGKLTPEDATPHQIRMQIAARAQSRFRQRQQMQNKPGNTAMVAGEFCMETPNANAFATVTSPIEHVEPLGEMDEKAYVGMIFRMSVDESPDRTTVKPRVQICYIAMYSDTLLAGVEKLGPFFDRLADAYIAADIGREHNRIRTGEVFYTPIGNFNDFIGQNNVSRAYMVWKSAYTYKSFSETLPLNSHSVDAKSRLQSISDYLFSTDGAQEDLKLAAYAMRQRDSLSSLVMQSVFEHVGGTMSQPTTDSAGLTSYSNRKAKYMISVNLFLTPMGSWYARGKGKSNSDDRILDSLIVKLSRSLLAASLYPEGRLPTGDATPSTITKMTCPTRYSGYSNYGDFDLAAGRRFESAYYISPSHHRDTPDADSPSYPTWLDPAIPAPLDLSVSDACMAPAGNEKLALLRLTKLMYDPDGVFSADSEARFAPTSVAFDTPTATPDIAAQRRPFARDQMPTDSSSANLPKWLDTSQQFGTSKCDLRLVIDSDEVTKTSPMAGRFCVLVGASEGSLAHRAAFVLARLGCTVSISTRSRRSCNAAVASLLRSQRLSGTRSPAPTCLGGFDLRDPREIRALARAMGDNIDVLIFSAAISEPFRAHNETTSPGGWENAHFPDKPQDTMATNHYAPFLLIHELLRTRSFARSRPSGFHVAAPAVPPRVVLVGSFASDMVLADDVKALHDADFNYVKAWGEQPFFPGGTATMGELRAYGVTKLLNAWLAYFLDQSAQRCRTAEMCPSAPTKVDPSSLPTFHVAVPTVTTLTSITKKMESSQQFMSMPNVGASLAEGAASLLAAATGAHDGARRHSGGVHVQCTFAPFDRAELIPAPMRRGRDDEKDITFASKSSPIKTINSEMLNALACDAYVKTALHIQSQSVHTEVFGEGAQPCEKDEL